MGLLKHFVLPVLAVFHLFVVFKIVNQKDYPGIIETFGWPPKEDGSTEVTKWEKHSLGILGGAHLAFLIVVVMGIFREDAHFRGSMALMETVYWLVGALDAQTLGFPNGFAYALAALCGAGFVVNLLEPGIFTKDKTAKAASGRDKTS